MLSCPCCYVTASYNKVGALCNKVCITALCNKVYVAAFCNKACVTALCNTEFSVCSSMSNLLI